MNEDTKKCLNIANEVTEIQKKLIGDLEELVEDQRRALTYLINRVSVEDQLKVQEILRRRG